MESIALKASLRETTGKKSSKTIRTQEGVPCILYGGKENINFFAADSDFRNIIFTPKVYIVEIDIDGNVRPAIVKELQFHPVTDQLLHADFYMVTDQKPITVEIPVKLNGSSVGVREGGKLSTDKHKLKVKGLAKDIPAEIEIDINELGIGKSIRAGEIETDGKYKIVMAKETPIVSVRTTRAAAAAAQEAAKQS